jgi:hypothetical protein
VDALDELHMLASISVINVAELNIYSSFIRQKLTVNARSTFGAAQIRFYNPLLAELSLFPLSVGLFLQCKGLKISTLCGSGLSEVPCRVHSDRHSSPKLKRVTDFSIYGSILVLTQFQLPGFCRIPCPCGLCLPG